MAVCERDPNHVYPGHNKTCPWCAVSTRAAAPAQVAMPPVSNPPPSPAPILPPSPAPTSRGRRRPAISVAVSVWLALGLAVAAFVGVFLIELALFGNTSDPGAVPALVATPFIVAAAMMIVTLVLCARTRR